MPPVKRPSKSLAESQIDWKKTYDVSRRFDLTLELLCALDCHSVHEDSDPEEDSAEALSVFVATCAYVLQSFAVPEKEACASFRRMYKLMAKTEKRLKDHKGKSPTARDVFTEVALAVTEDEI